SPRPDRLAPPVPTTSSTIFSGVEPGPPATDTAPDRHTRMPKSAAKRRQPRRLPPLTSPMKHRGWHLPGPENERNTIYSGPPGGVFWVSADAREPEAASQLLHRMSTREFQAALARAMDQPPAMLEVVEEADVHPAYAECISFFEDDVL